MKMLRQWHCLQYELTYDFDFKQAHHKQAKNSRHEFRLRLDWMKLVYCVCVYVYVHVHKESMQWIFTINFSKGCEFSFFFFFLVEKVWKLQCKFMLISFDVYVFHSKILLEFWSLTFVLNSMPNEWFFSMIIFICVTEVKTIPILSI